ncbi:MAG: PAS domain-containing protein [Spirochaetales bacterium]|nr:PAS domain-containing protein [Spirochaetales bacterium]
MDPEKGTFTQYQPNPEDPDSIEHPHVWSIHEDKKGVLWIGSFGGGLIQFNQETGKFHSYHLEPTDPGSLSSNFVWFIFESNDDVLWIGTDGGGLNKLVMRTGQFNHILSQPAGEGGLSYNGINGIAEDSSGVLWLANDGGGFQSYNRDENEARLFIHDPEESNSINSNLTECILVDKKGIIWIGTYNGGLNSYDPESGRFAYHLSNVNDKNTLSDNRIWCLYEDQKEYLWIGTRNGLNRLDPLRKTFVQFLHDPENDKSLSNNGIWDIMEDSSGLLWVGTDHGLNRMVTEGEFSHYYSTTGDEKSLSHNNITSLLETSDGNLWIGTNGGLNRMDLHTGEINRYTVNNGMVSNSVRGIMEAPDGNLWITTMQGLTQLHPESGQMLTYTQKDGLQGSDFSRAYLTSATGEIIIGGLNGINIFNPLNIKRNDHIPPIVITSVQVLNREKIPGFQINLQKPLNLSYMEHSITFEFSALDYNNSEKNLYTYKLEGFDKTWISPGDRRTATYTNLDGGKYKFIVKGSNNHGEWNEEGTSLTIIVTNPLWMRWWAYLIYFILIVGTVFAVIEMIARNHRKQLTIAEEHNKELEAEISERQNAQTALAVSKQRLNFALDAAREGTWELFPITQETFYNDMWFKMLGYSPGFDSNNFDSWTDLIHPEDLPRVTKRMNDFLQSKEDEFAIEVRLKAADGSWRWIYDVGKVFDRDKSGDIIRMSGIHLDITERKIAEEELKKARNYISNIIDSMPSVLVGVTPGGIITQWNKRAAAVTGIPPEEAVGNTLEETYPLLSGQMERIQTAISLSKEQRVKKQFRLDGEEPVYEDITVYPLIADDIQGAVIRIEDVTEQVRLEEMMIQSEKMLSVGGLAAGMAHEINNPLAGMMQTANVVKNRLENPELLANIKAAEELGITMENISDFMKSRGIFRMLSSISEAGERAVGIVANMLSFSRKSDDSFSSVNPVNLIEKTLELAATDYDMKKQQDFKTIKIVKEYDTNLPRISCDAARIQQVLLNIFRNGAEAMQETAAAGLKKDPIFTIRLKHEKNKKSLRIEIEDNGPGIEEKIRKRIFEPFFTTKPVGIGTGLGLSVSYFIITENHGGTMDVTSEPGKGTIFEILLPLNRK